MPAAPASLPAPAAVPAPRPAGDLALTGAQRAAILLISLGIEAASKVLPLLGDREVERISVEIARFRNVSSEVVDKVLTDYRDMAMAQNYVAQGGLRYARQVLEQSLGSARAEEIMMKVEATMEVSAFHLLQTVEIGQLTAFIENEHPQTAALILAHLNPRKAADIVNKLTEGRQAEVIYRLATMGKTSPELLRDIEEVIRQQLGSIFGAEVAHAGGIEKVAQILNGASRSVEHGIMEALRYRDPALATAIKGLMFVFDDLVHVASRDLQRLLMEVEQQDLVLALKGAPEALKEKVFQNVSDRVAQTIREELDLLGPVRVRDVEDAQRRILDRAQELEEREEISLAGHGEDQLI